MMTKKFDVCVGNPPFKQGLFRSFMKQILEELLTEEGRLLQISPDDRFSNKNHETLPIMQKYGLQSVTDCHDHFSVKTAYPLVVYSFDKNKKTNSSLFQRKLSQKEKITQRIMDKVQIKCDQNGTLNNRSVGLPPIKKGPESEILVHAIVSCTNKSGEQYGDLPNKQARFIEDASQFFFTNYFFGTNSEDFTVIKGRGSVYIHHDNICVIENADYLSQEDFNRIYNDKICKFVLQTAIGKNVMRVLGPHIRKLPRIPAKVKNLQKYFGLSDSEMAHIENERR